MPINPISLGRVSQNLMATASLNSLRRGQIELFLEEQRIASGRSFLTPSEDPVAATAASRLSRLLARHGQFLANLDHADNVLAASDNAMTQINDLIIEAADIASYSVNSTTSAEERSAQAEVIASIRNQLMAIGNTFFNGRYIFGGHQTTSTPFVDALGGVAYVGDSGDIEIRADFDSSAVINVTGDALFGSLSGLVTGSADLSASFTAETRLEDVLPVGTGTLAKGNLIINEAGGAGVITVDLSSADTVGDVVDRINAAADEAGSSLSAAITTAGVEITPGSFDITIADDAPEGVAAYLGLTTSTATGDPIVSTATAAQLTALTPVTALGGGDGVDLTGGLVITNGSTVVTVDLSAAQTMQDVLNAINNAGAYVRAEINDAGTGIDVVNLVSGAALSIAENGGTTAADLGIRTLTTETTLSELNHGAGVGTIEGQSDLLITAKDGTTFEVNLDGATTLGDVIDLINDAALSAGVAVSAALSTSGNGILIEDTTSGTGSLSVAGINGSTAAIDLGIAGTADAAASELVGTDVNTRRTESIFDVLIQLESALRTNDTNEIARAAERLELQREEITRVHGITGARGATMQARIAQMEDAAATAEIQLSQVQDLDFAEAATRLQTATTQFEATLAISSRLFSLSLLDFLA